MQKHIDFYTKQLGMQLLRQRDIPEDKYSNAFLGYGPETTNFAGNNLCRGREGGREGGEGGEGGARALKEGGWVGGVFSQTMLIAQLQALLPWTSRPQCLLLGNQNC